MYKLTFFIPEYHLESIKSALFKLGAGQIGHYEQCAWQVMGTGQYKPTEKSNPYQGSVGTLETAREYKVEMQIPDHIVKKVLKALIEAHPYEEPVYSVWKVQTIEDFKDE